MKELTPTGKLRVGVNLSNFLLVQRNADGSIRGIVPDLAQELAQRLGVAAELRKYEKVGEVADGAKKGEWDVAFIGAEPQRAAEIDFTAPYVEIEATYLVPAGSPIKSMGDVDHKGVRIAVADRSAYHLWLSRNIKNAALMTADGIEASYQLFINDKLEVLAGLKPRLMDDVAKLPGSKVLDGRFTAVQQAIGTPKGRPEGAAYLRKFVEDVKASGLVAQLIARHGIRGLLVAAPG
ncbi:MAG: ABC transporter substrate-binding protein [Proteobacteria bacterium]|nr:ABC transporter substrate-binding protein [Pseudomonadota bacterium]